MAADGTQHRQRERRIQREQGAGQLRWIAQARCLAAALDLLAQPILLVLPGWPIAIWHANAAARRQLAASGVLQIRDETLHVGTPADATELARVIRRAQMQGPLAPQQLELSTEPGGATARLHVQALDFGASPDLPVSEVLRLELHEQVPPEQLLQRLCHEFQLTRKEAECAIGLYVAGSVEEFTRRVGKSIHTVRTQLKIAMQKTATHTQAGLVALVANRVNS